MRAFDLDSFPAERPTWMAFLEEIAPAAFWVPLFSSEGYWDARTRLQEVDAAMKATLGFGLDRLRREATAFFETHLLPRVVLPRHPDSR